MGQYDFMFQVAKDAATGTNSTGLGIGNGVNVVEQYHTGYKPATHVPVTVVNKPERESNGSGFDWGALFGALPGMANGAANIVLATKGGPAAPNANYYINNEQQQQPTPLNTQTFLVIGAALVFIVIVILLLK